MQSKTQAPAGNPEPKKMPYETPKLRKFGGISELTATSNIDGAVNDAVTGPPNKTS